MNQEAQKIQKQPHKNFLHTSTQINENENQILSNLKLSNENYKNKKLFCIFEKNSMLEKCLGISYVEIDQIKIKSQNQIKIFSGDFPFFNISSFPLFISKIEPDLILLHCSLESKINEIFKNENLKEKIIQIPNINIQYKFIQTILLNYFQNNCNFNNIYSNSIVSQILSSLSFNSQCALYTIFNLILKYQNSNENFQYPINFERINFENMLFVSNKTQKELNIFNEQIHPSLIKGFGKSKEGLSLYNLLNKCQTNQGKKLLKNFLEFPIENEEQIEKRYECINDFIKINNYSFIKGITNELSHIKDFDILIKELKGFIVNTKTWSSFFSNLCSSLKILEIYKNKKNKIEIIDDYFELINYENLIKIYDFLFNCFDFTKGKNIEISIKNGINEFLDELRIQYIEIDKILQDFALIYKEKIPKNSFIDKFMFIFIPQLGYMFAVAKNENYNQYIKKQFIKLIKEEKNFDNNNNYNNEESEINTFSSNKNSSSNLISSSNIENEKNEMSQIKEEENEQEDISEKKIDITNNENENENVEEYDFDISNYDETLILKKITFQNIDLNFQFHDEDMIYYKNEITNNLDKNYGDLAGKITDCQNATFREISKQILEFENDILNVNLFISYLDVFIHFYIISEKYELYKPNISLINDNIFNFEKGRNIITEMTLSQIQYVKNDFFSNKKDIFIIYGNVNSGKSNFLKLIGSIVYLAQIGCFVPGKNFNFTPFNKILTSIEINESSIEHMSGFTIESKEIKYLLDIFYEDFNNENKCNLLILLYNPFKKTSEKNQNCLLSGIINFFIKCILEKKNNKSCKIFICVNEENKNFLIKNNVIDFNICDFYHMKNKVKEGKFINLFEIEKCNINDLKIENDNNKNSRLFLAKDNGLDNSLFLRALEIQSILKKKEKIFPNIEKLIKVTSNLNIKINNLKISFNDYCKSEINIMDNSNEFKLIDELNDLFI